MDSKTLAKIKETINIEGEVLIDLKTLETLVDERDGYKKDITDIVSKIRRLLTQLGILMPDGTIQFKISKLVKGVTGALLNTSAAEEQFSYLADLAEPIIKYSETLVDKG